MASSTWRDGREGRNAITSRSDDISGATVVDKNHLFELKERERERRERERATERGRGREREREGGMEKERGDRGREDWFRSYPNIQVRN